MRDDERRAPLRQFIHGALDEHFRSGIDRTRRLVQNEHGRVFDHGARDGHELFLPRRQIGFVAHHGIVAFGQRHDKVMQPHCLARPHDVLVGNALFAVHHVFADGALEQPGILQDHTEQIVHVRAGEFVRGHAVDLDIALIDFVKAH